MKSLVMVIAQEGPPTLLLVRSLGKQDALHALPRDPVWDQAIASNVPCMRGSAPSPSTGRSFTTENPAFALPVWAHTGSDQSILILNLLELSR